MAGEGSSVTATAVATSREAVGRLSDGCTRLFPCLEDRATRSSLCLKTSVVFLHVISIGFLFLLDSYLIRKTQEEPWYTAVYLVLLLATLFQYFFTSYSSPGYVIDAMMAGNGSHTSFTSLSNSMQRQAAPKYGINQSNQTNSLLWMKQVMDLYPPGFSTRSWTCNYCHLIQPPRTKHCHDCDKCVLQFDHHCTWLGTCIGKGNHCRFWWYLFEESVLCTWTVSLYITILHSKDMKAWWQDFIAVILLVVVLFCLMFLILLLLFHSYLALTNQTTYELMRRRRIVYFRGVPDKVHPFSKGICRNIFTFCCSCNNGYKLEAVPPLEELESSSRPYTCIDIVSCRCC